MELRKIAELLFDTKVNMSVARKNRAEIEDKFVEILKKHLRVKQTDQRGQGQRDVSEEEWVKIFGED